VSTGTMLMTDRQSRKGFRNPALLEEEAAALENLATDMRAIAAALRSQRIKSIEVDGVGKLHRAFDLVYEYLSKVDAAFAIAKRMNR
jgi:hypothetical protein